VETDQTATAAFLKAEEVATRLVEELRRLDDESKRYASAATTLEKAGEQLRALAESVQKNGALTSEVLTAMREVGTPAIVDGLDEVATAEEKTRLLVEELSTGIGDLKRLEAENTRIIAEYSATQKATTEALVKVRQTLESASQSQEGRIRLIMILASIAVLLSAAGVIVPFLR
jgi:hypothetical protein